MDSLPPESPGQTALRKQFPSLYITLVSIVIALAVESLLGRIGELNGIGTTSDGVVILLQLAHFVWVAGFFWWISARWVSTIPWPFGIFDGLSMILMLIGFHILSNTIGGPFAHWLLSFGVFSIAGAFIYRLNGRRGLVHSGRSEALVKQHRFPSSIGVVVGSILILLGWLGQDWNWSALARGLVVFGVLLASVVFAAADYWVWTRASAEPGRFGA